MKKQYLCAIIASAMLLSLAGCNQAPAGNTPGEGTEITAGTEITTETEAVIESTAPATTPVETTKEPEVTEPAQTTAEATTTPAPITPAPETTVATTPAPAVKDLAKIINDCVTAEIIQYCPPFSKAEADENSFLLEMLGITADQTEDFAISASGMNVQAYCVAIIKPVAGQEDAVLAAMNTYIENQQRSFENYLPKPYEIACAAKAEKLGDGTVVIVMCEDSDTVLKNIKNALK